MVFSASDIEDKRPAGEAAVWLPFMLLRARMAAPRRELGLP